MKSNTRASVHMMSMRTFDGYAVRTPADLAEAAGEKVSNYWPGHIRVFRTAERAHSKRNYETREGEVYAVRLTVPDDAYFAATGDKDMSEGRGGARSVGNFRDYWMAFGAAFGEGAQGTLGYISIMTPGEQDITITDDDGQEIVLATTTVYRPRSVKGFVEFIGEPIPGIPARRR